MLLQICKHLVNDIFPSFRQFNIHNHSTHQRNSFQNKEAQILELEVIPKYEMKRCCSINATYAFPIHSEIKEKERENKI